MTELLNSITVSADVLLVIASFVAVFSFSSIIASWTVGRWPILALLAFAISMGLFYVVHTELTDGLEVMDVPNAFINVAALILN